ncbi:MAG: hypothetical protein EOM47_02540 [Bacteroidia bacterium]|nr:hypothetical protein [Bacteroidia bacterium]
MYVMKRIYFIAAILLFLNVSARAQGDNYFKNKQYSVAIAAYNDEVKTNPEKYQNLAKSYFGVRNFPAAIEAMENYKSKYAKANVAYADWFIALLKRNDSESVVLPVKGLINTAGSESVPRISADGNRLYFKAIDRAGGMGGEDIWYSDRQADGSWGKPVLFSDLSTNSHETLYSISADGRVAILFGNYTGTFGDGDLFYSVKSGSSWTVPCNLGGAINTKKWEAQAAISPDGKTIVFITSNKLPGYVGDNDLYFSHLTDNGWTKPKNLGTKINTKGSETRPAFASDGKTLYFSSDGHMGFGGTDIFMVRRLDDSWTNWTDPVNLGRYINTLFDDQDISVNANGTIGYTVKYDQPGAPGDYDIYQFVMPEIARPDQTIKLYGNVLNEVDSAAAVNLKITNLRTNKVEVVTPSLASDGSYSVNLPFEKYLVEINMKGFLYHAEEIDLSDRASFLPKFTFKEKIGAESQAKIDQLLVKVDTFNTQLGKINKSESYDLKNTFSGYDDLLNNYKSTLTDIQKIVNDRKYAWLSEETKYVDVLRNFKVQRASKGATFKLENIFFDLGKSTLKPESKPSLDDLFNILQKNPISIELGGHSDSIGSAESNLQLSQERVNSVKNYLVNKGIATDRIVAVGYGEEKPVATNETDEGRAKNRRVEVKIIEKVVQGREGVENDLVDKPAEPEAEVVLPTAVISDEELVTKLRKAANVGGMPADSPCNDKPVVSKTKSSKTKVIRERKVRTPKTTKIRKSRTARVSSSGAAAAASGSSASGSSAYIGSGSGFGSSLSFDEFEKDDYIYRPFTVGVENFGTLDNSSFAGYNLRLVNRKKLESRGKVREHNFAYFPSNDTYSYGAGYQYLRFISIKDWTSLPVGFVWGFEGKYFKNNGLNGTTDDKGYFGIPVGFKGLIGISKFVLSPDVYYYYGLYSPKAETNIGIKSNYWGVGANLRWRFVYGGVHLNVGKSINYLGLRAGLTF